jgi:hypothetical protein
MGEGENVRIQKGQTKSVEQEKKDSTIGLQAMLSTFTEKFENRMIKMEDSLRENCREIEDRIMGKLEDRLRENGREMLTSVSKTMRDLEQRMNSRGESLNDEVRSMYELCHGQIRTLTEVVQYSNNHIESLRSDVTAFHAQIKRQSYDMCERMSTFETRVTDFGGMMKQQIRVSSEIETIHHKVTNECDKLRGQLEHLNNYNHGGSNGNGVNARDVMPASCQTVTSGGQTSSNSGINTSDDSSQVNGGPQDKTVKEVGLGGHQQSCFLNSVPNKGMTYNNNWEFVKGTITNTLDIALPTFKDLPEQNAQDHMNAVIEFLQIKKIPPLLHLAVARRSLRGMSVTTWGDAIWDELKTFEDFRKAFLNKFWGLPRQAKVRLQIYQDKHDPRGAVNYYDHLMTYAVKAKYLEPPMPNLELLNALKEHYPIGVKQAWIVAKPRTLQDAAEFLSDVMSLEHNPESQGQGRPAYPEQRDSYHRQHSNPRDDHRGSWNQNQQPDNRNEYRDQDWQGRESRNHHPDRDRNRRNQATAVSTSSHGPETRDRQHQRAENRS